MKRKLKCDYLNDNFIELLCTNILIVVKKHNNLELRFTETEIWAELPVMQA
jgi:hypothetical protein